MQIINKNAPVMVPESQVNTLRNSILNRQFRIGTLESQQVLRLKTEKDEDKSRLCLDIFS
jgi:hypothetical protein